MRIVVLHEGINTENGTDSIIIVVSMQLRK